MIQSTNTIGIEQKSTVDTIQSKLLQRICFLDYHPGHQLKEAVLAEEFGVSRTPVRDAISKINHLGLVETRNGVGTVVVALTSTKIRHVYEMRLELATLIGTMSPRAITQEDRKLGRELLHAAEELKHGFDPRKYVDVNHRLHGLIASMIGNSVLKSFWWQTYYQAASTWYGISNQFGSEMAHALVAELRDINLAFDNDDVQAIGFIQRTHISYGYQRIKARLLTPESE